MIRRFDAFSDNYIWGVEICETMCLIDPGESHQVLKYFEKSSRLASIGAILITHLHHDHVGGIGKLVSSKFFGSDDSILLNGSPLVGGLPIFGPGDCQKYGVEQVVSDGDIISIASNTFEIFDIPGHTKNHVGYFLKSEDNEHRPAFFCGDTLFGGGCGRVLGGDITDLYKSLKKISKLPRETLIYCAHEYTETNLKFANENFPNNREITKRYEKVKKDRENLLPTIPTELSCELATNPYLTCKNFKEFKEIRISKDNWKG